MNPLETHPIVAGARPQTPLWIIAILLAIIATALWLGPRDPWTPAALAQNQALAGARGVFAFAGPLTRDQHGLFMLDVDQGTVWCYAFDTTGGTPKMRLIAARTWLYDRYLQDFNCAAPDFRMVQQLVSQQRAGAAGSSSLSDGSPTQVPAAQRDDSPRP